MQIVINIPDEIRQDILTDGVLYCDYNSIIRDAIKNGIVLPKRHGRLIDADAFADKIKEVSLRHRYEDLKLNRICTVADVLNAVTHDLKGTALNGYELCPTVIEANKGE